MTSERPRPKSRLDQIESYAHQFPGLDPEAMRSYLALRRLDDLLEWALDIHLARHDLSFGRFIVMVHLMRAPGHSLTPAELSEACSVTRATITGLVDTLEKAEQVIREPDPDDGRSFMVRLTLSGRRFLEKLLPDHFRRLTNLMIGLSHPEMRELQRLLSKVAENISAFSEL
jgi:DNA-binding MarR family transcriptional regulator